MNDYLRLIIYNLIIFYVNWGLLNTILAIVEYLYVQKCNFSLINKCTYTSNDYKNICINE